MEELNFNNEVAEQVVDATEGNNGISSAVIVGGSMVAGAVLWNHVVKPIGRMLRTKYQEFRAARRIKKEEGKPEIQSTVE